MRASTGDYPGVVTITNRPLSKRRVGGGMGYITSKDNELCVQKHSVVAFLVLILVWCSCVDSVMSMCMSRQRQKEQARLPYFLSALPSTYVFPQAMFGIPYMRLLPSPLSLSPALCLFRAQGQDTGASMIFLGFQTALLS